jgi:DNA-binding transcriptional LysR family regulator
VVAASCRAVSDYMVISIRVIESQSRCRQTYEAAGVAGLGLIQAPLLAIGRYLESGALIELLPDFPHTPLDVSLVVAHRRNLSRRVRAFMKWIENVLAPYRG